EGERPEREEGAHEEDEGRAGVQEGVDPFPPTSTDPEATSGGPREHLQGATPPPLPLPDQMRGPIHGLDPDVRVEHPDPQAGLRETQRVLEVLREAGFVPRPQCLADAPSK